MLKLSIEKHEIRQSFKWKRQTHPWDMIGEFAKTKHLEQPTWTHEVAKRFRKNLFSFNEGPTGLSNEVFLSPQEPNPEQNLTDKLHLFEESQKLDEGFFPCPSCTCWFYNRRDLDFHIKRWCDR